MNMCLGLTVPSSSAPQQLLHCIFVTSAAGFNYVPGTRYFHLSIYPPFRGHLEVLMCEMLLDVPTVDTDDGSLLL